MRYTTQEMIDRYNVPVTRYRDRARSLRNYLESQGIEYRRYGQTRRTRWEIVE